MKRRTHIGWAGVLVTMLLLWGCVSSPPNGNQASTTDHAIFRHRWWNHYARGLVAAEALNYAAAVEDLETALDQRARDQRMARTYGMHFVDYFPHRELGIVFWLTDRLTDAQAHLETSIAQTPTTKAYLYLDKVRTKQIQRRILEQGVMPPPPEIHLDVSEEQFRTREDPVILRGTAADNNFINAVRIGERSVFLEGAKRRVDFQEAFDLPQGEHRIEIRAGSLSGETTKKTITLQVDRQGPVLDIGILTLDPTTAKSYLLLSGQALDPSNIATLVVNQRPIKLSPATRVPFQVRISAEDTEVILRATDKLGNQTRLRFSLSQLKALSRLPTSVLIAANSTSGLISGLFGSTDEKPPTIRLQGWTASQTVYMDKVVIDGFVQDSGRIKTITINEEPVIEEPLNGIFTAFSGSVELQQGENEVVIEAWDTIGNRAVKKIHIDRQIPRAKLIEERLSVSVLPFAQHGNITTAGDGFQDLFLHQLASRERFKLVDRALFDKILQEHKISRTGLVSPDTALRAGKLSAADAFINGSMIDTRLGIEVISKVVDTETAEVLTTVDTFVEADKKEQLQMAAEHLALKIHREFPLVDGTVLKRNKKQIITDLGSTKIRAQRRVLIVNETPMRHPVTHLSLGSDWQIVGRARLIQVQEAFSKGELDKASDPAIGTAHGVITQ